MKTDIAFLEHAGKILTNLAQDLRQAHNSDPENPCWKNESEAKAAHDDITDTAKRMFALAERLRSAWHPVTDMPDSDTTVQLFDKEASEPVWPGYFDGSRWLYIDGVVAKPTHWADMPEGPTA